MPHVDQRIGELGHAAWMGPRSSTANGGAPAKMTAVHDRRATSVAGIDAVRGAPELAAQLANASDNMAASSIRSAIRSACRVVSIGMPRGQSNRGTDRALENSATHSG